MIWRGRWASTQPVLVGDALLRARAMWVAIAVLIALQLAITYAPVMHTLFGITPIGLQDRMRILLFGAEVFTIVELEEALIRPMPRVHTALGDA